MSLLIILTRNLHYLAIFKSQCKEEYEFLFFFSLAELCYSGLHNMKY